MKLKRISVSMEGNSGMSGGMRPTNMSSAGMLGLEMLLHHPQQQQQHHQQNHMLAFPPQPLVPDQHSMRQQPSYPHYGVKRGHQQHQQQPAMSSEDEPGFGDDGADGAKLLSPSQSPWTRMKWTDSTVRLLISVVYCVGDDGGGTAASGEGEQQAHHSSSAAGRGRKGGGGGAAASLLQKKGKWKSVSRAMMEKGFYVAPQQCEDKFNDLNKRYKRVNELLGKETACRVVENPALLDTMDHLPPKAKEEARKLVNSKHLFFREMCDYHNAGAPTLPSSVTPDPQPCFAHPHSRVEPAAATGKGSGPVAPSASAAAAVAVDQMEHAMGADKEEEDDNDDDVSSEDDDDDDGDDEDEYDDDGDDQDDVGNKQHRHHYHHQHQKREDQQVDGESGGKRAKRTSQLLFPTSASPPLSLSLSSPVSATSIHQLSGELMAMSAGVGGEQQQSQMTQWLRRKETELEEQSVEYQCRAFQLERQRFKWLRFSTKKEREMERMKLQNDRLRLENERMLLLLRQKELELATSNGDQSKNNNNINANPKRPAEHHLNPNDHDQPFA